MILPQIQFKFVADSSTLSETFFFICLNLCTHVLVWVDDAFWNRDNVSGVTGEAQEFSSLAGLPPNEPLLDFDPLVYAFDLIEV